MTLTSSITNAVVVLIVVVVVIGAVLGLTASGTDLLNPQTSMAKQRQIDAETAHMTELNRIAEQKLEEENRIEAELQKRKADLELTLLPIREYLFTAAQVFAVVIVAIGVAFLLARLGYRWSGIGDQAEDVWKVQAYRDARIQLARENERHFRGAFPPQPVAQAPSVAGGDGHHQVPAPFGAGNAAQRRKQHLTPAGAAS